jgi:putative endonuclease
MQYYVYMMTNAKYGTIYTGVTNDLVSRTTDHREKKKAGFTKRYNLTKLVHYEPYADVRDAIHREKCIKAWKREWKIALIEKENPDWRDLYEEILK